jgi:hypothetical protein
LCYEIVQFNPLLLISTATSQCRLDIGRSRGMLITWLSKIDKPSELAQSTIPTDGYCPTSVGLVRYLAVLASWPAYSLLTTHIENCSDTNVLQDRANSNAGHNFVYAFLPHLDPIVLLDRNFGAAARAILKHGSESIIYSHLLEC